ncbi:MAG: hypothetical protein H0W75_12425 [Chitinophagaceae bacterium]|nr:hypothetical protein [Chitinophagaceae bacterium]
MHLIIDIDTIKEQTKREWLLNTLRLMNIGFKTGESRQTIEEYNIEIAEGEAEIERGEFVTAEQLKKDSASW